MKDLAYELGKKAKDLLEGMQRRVKRDPDIADFSAAFECLLAERYTPFRPESPAPPLPSASNNEILAWFTTQFWPWWEKQPRS